MFLTFLICHIFNSTGSWELNFDGMEWDIKLDRDMLHTYNDGNVYLCHRPTISLTSTETAVIGGNLLDNETIRECSGAAASQFVN